MSVPTIAREYTLTKPADGLDALTIREVNVSAPKPTEVLLKIEAVSLNFRDLMVANYGEAQGRKNYFIPCSDAAGVIVALGSSVTRLTVGQRVAVNMALKHISGESSPEIIASMLGGGDVDGVLTQYRVFPEEAVTPFPDHLSFEEASTLPCAATTAWQTLSGAAPIKAGDTVLIQGTGGVALFCLQFSVAVGATVIITSSSDEKLSFAKSLGAKYTVNYKTTPDWDEKVTEITEKRGVDHVIELGGAGTLIKSTNCVRTGGHIHVVGIVSGAGDLSNLPIKLIMGSITLHGIGTASRVQFEEMNEFICSHGIKPVIDKVFAFEQAKEALGHLASQKHTGKVVIEV